MSKVIDNEIRSHAATLAEELNYRLLLDQDWHCGILVVESITVTAITYPKGKHAGLSSFIRRLFACVGRHFRRLFGKHRVQRDHLDTQTHSINSTN